jgi:hypothetical protein
MANYFPLIANAITGQIDELPAGSNLDLTDSGIVNLGGLTLSSANLHITGGSDGFFLQTDGTGNLTWAAGGNGGGGNGTPGGSNTEIQYNNAGDFGGITGFHYDNTSNVIFITAPNSFDVSETTAVALPNIANLTIGAGANLGLVVTADGNGGLYWGPGGGFTNANANGVAFDSYQNANISFIGSNIVSVSNSGPFTTTTVGVTGDANTHAVELRVTPTGIPVDNPFSENMDFGNLDPDFQIINSSLEIASNETWDLSGNPKASLINYDMGLLP